MNAVPGRTLEEALKALLSNWATYAAVGSFLVYLFGYLSLRFHLTAFGIEAELNLLDERYLFAGSRFLVYAVASIPILVVLGLVVLGLAWPPFLLARFVLARLPVRSGSELIANAASRLHRSWRRPLTPELLGIVLATGLIQFVMRQCFVFSNLLVRKTLPGPSWLQELLLTNNDAIRSLYFSALLAAVIACSGLLAAALARGAANGPWQSGLRALLAVLVAIALLLLPVNHGILIAGKTVPKVLVHDSKYESLEQCADTWMIWNGERLAVLSCRQDRAAESSWSLLMLERSIDQAMSIVGFDPILRLRFRP